MLMTEASRRSDSQHLLTTLSQIVTFVVSLTAFIYIAGATVLWIRLFRSDLPADSVVTSLPRELVVGVGLKSVVAPSVVLAAIGAAALGVMTVALRLGGTKRTHGSIAVIVGIAFFSAAILTLPGVGWAIGWALAAAAVYFGALAIGWLGKWHDPAFWDRTKIALAAALIGLLGAGIRVLTELADPRLDNAVVCVNDGGSKYDGLLIGESGQAIYLGQGRASDRVVVSIPKSRVAELWIGSDQRACSGIGGRRGDVPGSR